MKQIIPENIKTRFSSNGKLKIQLKLMTQVVHQYPNSQYAKSIFCRLKQKYWYGSRKVKYAELVEEAWSKLLPDKTIDIVSLGGVHLRNDFILTMEFTDIFLADPKFDHELYYTGDELIASKFLSSCYTEGPYQTSNVNLKKDDVVFDIGANMGLFSLFASNFSVKHIYAFEPQQQALEILGQNLLINQKNNLVDIIPYGLSNETGTYELNHLGSFHGASSIVLKRNNDGDSETIKCVTLDSWVKENSISKIDFIKADIEGAERFMLLGAKMILKEFAPKLAICTYHLPDDPQVIESIILDANPNYVIEHMSHKLFAYVP